MDDDYGFVIPSSFLTQLNEYSRGYMLLVCNEKGELFVHEAYDNPVIKLGLVNFANMHTSAALKHMHNMALKEEESLDDLDAEQDPDNEDVEDEDGQ